jgi:hypothetical protein
VVLARQRVAQLALHRQPRGSGQPVHLPAVEPVQVPDALRLRAVTRAPPRHVVLQRHLDQHAPGDARGLAQQRQRVRDVLEHVREHREVVRAVGGRNARAVEGLEPAGARDPARAGDLDRRRGQLEAVEARLRPGP